MTDISNPKGLTMIPDRLPTLAAGKHDEAAREVCAMEAAAWLAHERHSDTPSCVHPAIARMAQVVNDKVSAATRQTLWTLILRSMGTASEDKVLSVHLAVWCAREVLPLFEAKSDDTRPRAAIEAAESWAECPCARHAAAAAAATYAAYAAYSAAANAAYAAYSAAAATNATYAAYTAAAAAAYAAYSAAAAAAAYAAYSAAAAAAYAAYSAAAAERDTALVNLWTGLIDEYDRLTGRGESPTVSAEDWTRLTAFAR